MINLQKIRDTKEHILSKIQSFGPTFPTRISRETDISPLFVGALLSEMVSEKKLIMSSMKVGSSPLYYLKGQEAMLESFTQYLNGKEKETVQKLKEKKILDDSSEDPATRVALRKIKDFAVPMILSINNEERLFWRYFTLDEKEAINKIGGKAKIKAHAKEAPEIEKIEKVSDSPIIKMETLQKESIVPETQIIEPKKTKSKEKKDSIFAKTIRDYLIEKNIELLQELAIKNKEFHARIRTDTPLGKQEYFLIAKDKKKLTEDDLAIALHKAQAEKMPSFLLVKGDLDKTAKPYLEQWKNLIKFEKLKI